MSHIAGSASPIGAARQATRPLRLTDWTIWCVGVEMKYELWQPKDLDSDEPTNDFFFPEDNAQLRRFLKKTA
jgi:hypothetical protein